MQHSSPHTVLQFKNRCKQNWLESQLLQHNFDSWKKNKCCLSHPSNLDWAPSAIGFKGVIMDGTVVKFCSSIDSCWNLHSPSWLRHTFQLMRRDLDSPCSTWSKQSPSWNKSSTPGMYNLTKWLGDIADLGIQISLSLGSARCLSAYEGATLRKIGGEVKIGL